MSSQAVPFSRRIPPVREPNALSVALAEARASGRRILNLAETNPTKTDVALPAEEILAAVSRPACLAYDPDPRGLTAARAAVSDWYASSGPVVDQDEIFLTASTSEGYGWLFKLLCDPGDAVLVPKPGYPLFDYLAGLEGVESVSYRLEYEHPRGWRVDLDALEALVRTRRPKAVVLIHPNNPTGSYVSPGERGRISACCREARAALIVDEVFQPYALDDDPEPSFAGEAETPTLVLNGFSKLLGLPQMKLGWIAVAGPAGFRTEAAARLEIIADTYLSASAPIQHAARELLPRAAAFTGRLRERLTSNLSFLRAALEGEGSPHRVLRCSAGWTAVVEVPKLVSEEDMVLGLLREEDVYLHPGFLYDFEREAFLTVSLLVRPEVFREAVFRLKDFLDRLER